MTSKGFAFSLILVILITLFISANTSHEGFFGYVVGFCVCTGSYLVNGLLNEHK